MPLAAMEGTNVLENNEPLLQSWYTGPTLMSTLGTSTSNLRVRTDEVDKCEVPKRPYETPFRIPLSNVFKGQTAVASGVAVSGRLCSGIVQVGDRVRSVPGDEVGTIRSKPITSGFHRCTDVQQSRWTTILPHTPLPVRT
jgi:elongation factor 1 alpha-like protein